MKLRIIAAAVLLSGCETLPRGESTYLQYSPGSPERHCAELAYGQSPTGDGAGGAAEGAAAGAVGGAVLGAIFGALLGDPAGGAAWGAGLGLGSGAGAGVSRADMQDAKRTTLFAECMTHRWYLNVEDPQ